MLDVNKHSIEIVTGCFGRTPDEDKVVVELFGTAHTKHRFDVYFHWYNVIHELGHGILPFNCDLRLDPVQEEQLVNDFAVSFWLHYGEKEKLDELSIIIESALKRLICPAPGISHLDYAREKWGTMELMNFNNYGWFQFECVRSSLRIKRSFEAVLTQFGVRDIKTQPKETLTYPEVDEDATVEIIRCAANAVRKWGALLPDVHVTFDKSPNRQMCKIIDL